MNKGTSWHALSAGDSLRNALAAIKAKRKRTRSHSA